MNKTTNYQLNQWDPDDKVQRTDFNADNAKIDAAIKAVNQRADSLGTGKADKTALNALSARVDAALVRSSLVPLKTVTCSTGGSALEIDVSDIDWGQWQCVAMDWFIPEGGYRSNYLKVNGTQGGLYQIGPKDINYPGVAMELTDPGRWSGRVLFFPFGMADLYVHTLTFSTYNTIGYASVRYSQLETLNLVPRGGAEDFPAGYKFRFFGIR